MAWLSKIDVIKKHAVVRDGGCWEWDGCIKKEGYGVAHYLGKTYTAHRLSWMAHSGDIPDGMFICHKCDNRKCVNPEHLFVGTRRDNVDDAMSKSRFPRGEAHKRSKLSDEQVKEIRAMRRLFIPSGEIAKKYGVSSSRILQLCSDIVVEVARPRCDSCGLFRSWGDLKLTRFVPDSEFGPEKFEYICSTCGAKPDAENAE